MEHLVSVVMPVYNCEKYVGQALESVLSQKFEDFEIIIINDASIDRSEEVVRSYRDPRVVFITNKERNGVTRSMNKAIRLSKAKYIVRMDGDDVCLPDRLSAQIQFMEKNQEVAVAGSWAQIIDKDNKHKGILRYPTAPSFLHLLCSNLLNWPCIGHPTTIMRREIIDNIGLYNEKYLVCEDYELWLRIARRCSIRNIQRVLLSYRSHSESSSWREKELMKKEKADILLYYIQSYMPHLNLESQMSLVNLLLFKKQDNNYYGDKVLGLLDFFCQEVIKDARNRKAAGASRRGIYLKDYATFFYLPKLAATNCKLALRIFLDMFPKSYKWILSFRYAKMIRRSLISN
ncbi:MAG: glycosyltransferase [Candidatus Omnitrophica bacterium]|nr:glycosyltransferase [Candidatus Omnitrophota bacterium]